MIKWWTWGKYTLIMVLLSLNNKYVISVILQLQTIVHIDSYICACVGHGILMHWRIPVGAGDLSAQVTDGNSAQEYTLCTTQKSRKIPDLREQEIFKKQDYMTLLRIGRPAPDPNKSRSWLGKDDAMNKWPPLSHLEIQKFITKLGHSLSGNELTSYKTGKAYSYFFNDWIQEVFYHAINKDHKACFLKAKCTPVFMKLEDMVFNKSMHKKR